MPQHLTIPDEYAGGLALLVTLPDEAIHQLTSALSESPPSVDVKDANAVTSLISAKVPTIQSKDLRRIMAALLALYSVRISAEVSPDEFLDDLTQAVRRSRRAELSLDDAGVDKFRSRLKPLLTLSGLMIASKAVVIQHEHEHVLCTLRIFTDARPVYGEDTISPPATVAITHMLKLTYHEGPKTEEIHIAFDKEDLLHLKAQIARAESKVAGLKKVFESAKIQVIE